MAGGKTKKKQPDRCSGGVETSLFRFFPPVARIGNANKGKDGKTVAGGADNPSSTSTNTNTSTSASKDSNDLHGASSDVVDVSSVPLADWRCSIQKVAGDGNCAYRVADMIKQLFEHKGVLGTSEVDIERVKQDLLEKATKL